MAELRFSRRAEADLLSIAGYTFRTWGEDQTFRYIADLEACCQLLADNPLLGRHVIFYREAGGGVLDARILHQRMVPARYAIDEDEGQ